MLSYYVREKFDTRTGRLPRRQYDRYDECCLPVLNGVMHNFPSQLFGPLLYKCDIKYLMRFSCKGMIIISERVNLISVSTNVYTVHSVQSSS